MCLVSREYSDKFADARERHVGNRKVWFLDLIGRHPDRRERGKVLNTSADTHLLDTGAPKANANSVQESFGLSLNRFYSRRDGLRSPCGWRRTLPMRGTSTSTLDSGSRRRLSLGRGT